jgi:hypothetical protein
MAREGVERGAGDSPISARSTCTILLFKYTCVPPSAAVALSRVRRRAPGARRAPFFPITCHGLTVDLLFLP